MNIPLPQQALIRATVASLLAFAAIDAAAQSSQPTNPTGSVVQSTVVPIYSATTSLDTPNYPSRPAPLMRDPVAVFPALGLGAGYADGIILPDGSRTSSAATKLTLSLLSLAQTGAHRFSLRYLGQFTRFDASSIDNSDVHNVVFLADDKFTARVDAKTEVFWGRDYLDRVYNLTTGTTSAVPPKFERVGFNTLWGYGARDATGRIEFGFNHESYQYLNNLSVNSLSDNTRVGILGRFVVRVSPATRGFAEFIQNNYSYPNSDREYKDTVYSLGAGWDPSPLFSLTARLGQTKRDFSASQYSDNRFNTWSTGIQWKPLTYSSLTFDASRYAASNLLTAANLQSDLFKLTWRHTWTKQLSSQVIASQEKFNFVGLNRTDTVDQVGIKLGYEFRRFLQVGLDLNQQQRRSPAADGNYTRRVSMVTIGATL